MSEILPVTDPDKIVTDPEMLNELERQGIDKDFVELSEDYNIVHKYAKVYTDLKSKKKFQVISRLTKVNYAGERVVVGWDFIGGQYVSKANVFHAVVEAGRVTLTVINDQPTGLKTNDSVTWNPQLFIGGVEVKPKSASPTLLAIDPTNTNYSDNVLEWGYGVCVRRLRIIEGMLRERWIFPAMPTGDIRIVHNQTGDFKLGLGFAFDAAECGFITVDVVNEDEETVLLSDLSEVVFPFTICASATFYPDADPESSSTDGTVAEGGGDFTWSQLIAEDGSEVYTDTLYFQASSATHNTLSTKWKTMYRGIFLFNTATLPDDCEISVAVVSLSRGGIYDDAGIAPNVNIYSSNPASNINLVPGDYDSLGATAFCDTPIAYADYADGYNDFILNATGIAAINKTGVSKFGFRYAYYDAEANTPIHPNQLNKWTALNAFAAEKGAGYKPKLVITYTEPTWESPTGSVDGDWTDEANAYDENTGTYAELDNPSGWGSILELSWSATNCDKVRIWTARESTNITDIKVDVHKDSSWVNVFNSTMSAVGEYVEYSFTEGSVDGIRISYYNSHGVQNRWVRVHEVEYWDLGGAAQTYTSTVSLDAYIKALDSKAVNLDTYIMAQDTETISLDARIAGRDSKTVNLDVLVKALGLEKSVALDALIQALGETKTVDLDALIAAMESETVDLDARLKAVDSEGVDLDAVISGAGTKTVDLDALIQALGETKTVDLDAFVLTRGKWVKPVSYVANGWTDPELAYDGNPATGAYYDVPGGITYSPYLELNLEKHTNVDFIEFHIDREDSDINWVEIDAYYSSGWNTVWQSGPVAADWDIYLYKNITMQDISAFRIRFLNSGVSGNRWAMLNEFTAWSIVTEYTATVTLDALIKATGLDQAVALDALIKASDISTVDLDALIKGPASETVDVDVLVQAQKILESVDLDARIAAREGETVSLDTLIQALGLLKSVALDAIITGVGTEAIDLDVLIKALGIPKTVALDALINAIESEAIDLDVLIKGPASEAIDLDALVKALGIPKTVALDALVRASDQETIDLDVFIQALGLSATVDLDVNVAGREMKAVDLDALLKGIGTEGVDLDALLKGPWSQTIDLDVILGVGGIQEVDLDVLLKGLGITKTVALDVLIQVSGVTKTVALDALVSAVESETVDLDVLVQAAGILETIDLDTLIMALGISTAVDIDALIQGIASQTVDLDTLLAGPGSETIDLDAFIAAVGLPKTVALDAILSGAGTEAVDLDVLLKGLGIPLNVALDALLKGVALKSVDLDVLVKAIEQTATVDIDALLAAQGLDTVSLDALLRGAAMVTVQLDVLIGVVDVQGIFMAMEIFTDQAVGLVVETDEALDVEVETDQALELECETW